MDGVTFAGQSAVLDYDRRIANYVAERWPETRWPFYQGKNDIPLAADPFGQHEIANRFRLPYPDVPAPRISEVIIPTGASRYGRGLFLFGRAEMESIAADVWGYSGGLESLPSTWGGLDELQELRIEYEGNVFTCQMRALPPILVDASGDNELWLLPLVDHRYQLAQQPSDFFLTQGDGWDELTAWTLPGSAHGDPDRESFSDPGITLSVALDAIALSTGRRIVTDHAAIVTPGSESAKLSSNLQIAKPWLGGQVPSRSQPANVTVIGRIAVDHFGQCGESYDVTKPIGSGSGNAARVVVHSPWYVEHFRERQSEDAIIAVDAASLVGFNALASQIAADIASWGAIQYAISIPGVFAWELCGYDDYTSIRVGGIDNLDSVSTHVQSLPPDFAPLVHLGQKPNIYVHPNDSALFTLTESAEAEPGDWVEAEITEMDGYYSGTDTRPVLIKTFAAECSPDLASGAIMFAHYQCEQGWHVGPSMEQLPAWEVEATLTDVLYANQPTGTAQFVSIRSNFPHTGTPPGIVAGMITFQNKWRLDALCDSKVILQRIANECGTGCEASCEVTYHTGSPGYWTYSGTPCPEGCECPPLPIDHPAEPTTRLLDCTPAARWELRKVEKYKARWIKVSVAAGGGSPVLVAFWEGDDPTLCGETLNVELPIGSPCNASEGLAFYDPFTDTYQFVGSPAGTLGSSQATSVVSAIAYDGCSLNYIKQTVRTFAATCDGDDGGEPVLLQTEPALSAIEVLTSASLLSAIAECDNVCRYEWDGVNTWVRTQACSSGDDTPCSCANHVLSPPGPNDPWVVEFPCDRDDGQTPRTGSLSFGSATILVCGSAGGSGFAIPLTTCPDPPA